MVLSDVLGVEELVGILVKVVAFGGNLLLNVGPTSDGRIVPIFEERLRQVGCWLQTNGEAIYGTKPYKYQNDSITPKVWYCRLSGLGSLFLGFIWIGLHFRLA